MATEWDFGDQYPKPPTKRPSEFYLSKNLKIPQDSEVRGSRGSGYRYSGFSYPYLIGEVQKFASFWGIEPEEVFIIDAGRASFTLSAWVPMTKNDRITYEERKAKIADSRQRAKLTREANKKKKQQEEQEDKKALYEQLKKEFES